MNDLGWISSDQLEASVNQPVSPVGYRKYTKKAPYFTDYLFKQFSELYSPEVLSSEGFTIYTTLDTQVQTAAEKALEQGLSRLEKHNPGLKHQEAGKKLQGAIVVMQPKTGYILAMVGGRQYSVSQFNRITQARRQPGSAFKPFVYLSGLDRYTPASKLSNESKSYNVNGRIWQPRNYSQVAETSVRLRDALARSINLAAVDLAVNTGLENIVSTAEEFGFSTALKPYPSIALGAFEVIPLELARGYCAFAADGLLPHPMSLKDVVDESGQVLQRRHMDITRVTSIAKAFLMNSLLQSVVLSGSAHSLKNCGITFPAAGKTGTTNDYKDAWFVGYTPDVIALVWVGFDDGSSIQATGASAALPIWALLMKALPQHISGEWFEMPPGVVKRTVCTESGDLAISKACPETLSDFFLAKNMPESFCRRHVVQGPVKKFFNSLIKYFKKD
jgi:penicillin-binding protein 1B